MFVKIDAMRPWRFSLLLLFSLFALTACQEDDSTVTEPEEDPTAGNKLTLGASSGDLLTAGDFDRLVVEFVYSDGFRPRQETINNFRAFLDERLNKPGGITFVETVIDPPTGAPFNSSEIREIEDANRTLYNTDNTLAVYVFFSNGNAFGDSQTSFTLGTAYRNTSLVVFEKTLQDVSIDNPNFDLTALEITTLNHEFGHILGLTNVLQDDIHSGHEDPNADKHCIVEECLMYFQAQAATKSMMSRMSRENLPQLDELCIEDLRAKGGK